MKALKIILVGITALWILFPFAYLGVLSFSEGWTFPQVMPSSFTFKHWMKIYFSEIGLIKSALDSLIISIVVASFSTLSGFFMSRMIAYHRYREAFMFMTYIPYLIAPVVFAVCISYYFIKIGLYGTILGVILAQFLIAFPYAVIFFSSFWNQKMKQYKQLVHTLGGSSKDVYLSVFFPLGKGLLLICFFQTFLISWFEYGLTAYIGVGKVQTLTIKVFMFIQEANFYYGAISCVLLLIPPIILMYMNKKYIFRA